MNTFDVVPPDEDGAAIAGDYGTAICDMQDGLAVAGDFGIAIASDEFGTAAAGVGGIILLAYWDDAARRVRIKTAYVGENGILPDVAYGLDDDHEFFEL